MPTAIAKEIRAKIKVVPHWFPVSVRSRAGSGVTVAVKGDFLYHPEKTVDEAYSCLRSVLQATLDAYCAEPHHWFTLKIETPVRWFTILSDGTPGTVTADLQIVKATK